MGRGTAAVEEILDEASSSSGHRRLTLVFSKARHLAIYNKLEKMSEADFDRPISDTALIALEHFFNSQENKNA